MAGAIYLAVAFTASMLVETDVLVGSTGPLLEVVRVAGLAFPPWLFALIALLAVMNTALINMMMASRLVYGMARERIVPAVLGRVHRRRRTPVVAIAFTVVLALTLTATGDLGDLADTTVLLRRFDEHEAEFTRLIEAKLALPAYEQVMKASHTFNLLDARRAISVTERQRYILRVRTMARAVAQAYYDSREALGFPMLEGGAPAPAGASA